MVRGEKGIIVTGLKKKRKGERREEEERRKRRKEGKKERRKRKRGGEDSYFLDSSAHALEVEHRNQPSFTPDDHSHRLLSPFSKTDI